MGKKRLNFFCRFFHKKARGRGAASFIMKIWIFFWSFGQWVRAEGGEGVGERSWRIFHLIVYESMTL